jgi:hypothetical protein
MGMEVAKSPADLISKVPVVFINHFDSNAVGGGMSWRVRKGSSRAIERES